MDLFNDHTYGWTNTSLEIEVSTGSRFPPMKLPAYVFRPKSWDLLQVHQYGFESSAGRSQPVCRFSAPIGLMALSPSAPLRLECKEHIEKMMRAPGYVLESTAAQATHIPFLILNAIHKYSSAGTVRTPSVFEDFVTNAR